MASTAVELVIALVAKDAASAALGQVGKKLDALGAAGQIAKVGIGLAAAGLGIAATAAVQFAKAAADEEQGMVRMAQAFKNAGEEDIPRVTAAVEKAIAGFETLTAFSDGEMRDALSMLTAQTGSVDEAMKRLPIAMDFATGAGIDLATASKLMGKVTDETVSVLGRYGIQVDKSAKATDVLALVQQKFGGQSAAFAKTAQGAWKQFGNQMDNLKEDIGGLLLPAFTEFGKVAVGAISALRDWLNKPEIQAAIKAISETLGRAKDIALEFFGVLTGTAPDAGAALTDAVGPDAAKVIMGALAGVRETIKTVVEWLGHVVSAAMKVIEWLNSSDDAAELLRAGLSLLWGVLSTVVGFIVNDVLAALGKMKDALGGLEPAVGKLRDMFDGFRLFFLQLWKDLVLGVSSAVNGVIGVINGFIEKYNALAAKLGLPQIGKIELITPNLADVNARIDQITHDRTARIFANVYEQAIGGGGGTRQFASGTPFVPFTGPAIVHRGEAIIPVERNPFAGGGFGGTIYTEVYLDGEVVATAVGSRFQRSRRLAGLGR